MGEHHPVVTAPPVALDVLSPRQREVITLIAEGLSNAEIARRLTVTPGTAANHVEAVLRRLGAGGRVQVAMWAVSHGLVTVAPPSGSNGVANGTREVAH